MRNVLDFRIIELFLIFIIVLSVSCKQTSETTENNQKQSLEIADNAKGIIIQMDKNWAQAALDKDIDKFANYMHSDYAGVVSGGRKLDKQSWVDKLRNSDVVYESVVLENIEVKVYNNLAMVQGEYIQKAIRDGEPEEVTGIYINTWIKENNSWQVIASGFGRTSE